MWHWLKKHWKTVAGGVAGLAAFAASLVAVADYFDKRDSSSGQITASRTATTPVQRLSVPIETEHARTFTHIHEGNPRELYFVNLRNGEYGRPRISRLYVQPSDDYAERILFNLAGDLKFVRELGDSEFLTLARTKETLIGGQLLEYDMDVLVFSVHGERLRQDKFNLSACWPYSPDSIVRNFKAMPNGYLLGISSGCRYATFGGEPDNSGRLKSNGEDFTDRATLAVIYDCDDSCFFTCERASEEAYRETRERYGTLGQPNRCSEEFFEAS